MIVTESQVSRIKNEWEKIADESLVIETGETVQCPIYAFGSELAVLRLFHKFSGADGMRIGFSKNMNTWFFVNK
jgi:hypothetical protein